MVLMTRDEVFLCPDPTTNRGAEGRKLEYLGTLSQSFVDSILVEIDEELIN